MRDFTSFGSIFDDAGPSGTVSQHNKTPAQKERDRAKRLKWEQAMRARDGWWTDADYAEEAARLQNEIAQWGNRNEA